ncbi:MAG: phosphotransferase [Ruminiclostridium sp.]|nr:phosphotransferase [Ruminiclostridium sp.]
MKAIGTGRQADVYEKDGQAFKVYKEWVSIEEIQYEADISQKVAEVCSIAPKFFGLVEQDGKQVLKLEYIQGGLLSSVMSKNIFRLKKNVQQMGRLHRKIHENTITGLKTVTEKFEERLLQFKDIDPDSLNKLMAFLNNSDKKALCHGDLHPENIIVDDTNKMRVIDWVDAYCGDPLSDVARTYYLLKHGTPPGERSNFEQLAQKQAGEFIGRVYLKSYFDGKPIPVRELNMWGLIIRICRSFDGIKEEQEPLKQSIDMGIQKLLRE